MIISIVSGKGGTGKTTIATNFALSMVNIQFIDCNVEEPNANIFLKSDIFERDDVNIEIPYIDKEKCNYCGKCADFCMYNALDVVHSDILFYPELCHSCGGCELVCPVEAIGCEYRTIGRVEHGSVGKIDFYQGILNVGEVQALPLIRSLKTKIDKNRDVIIDTSSGTSCNVIESINMSDYCIIVTEPNPFSFHDLGRIVEVLKYIGIPFGVIINRDGNDYKKVETFCSHEKIPVLLKIPNQKEIAELYSQGKPFVNRFPSWREEFSIVFEKIRRGLRNETTYTY